MKLRSVSSTESKIPLKLSENAHADSQPDEGNGDVRKSAQSSSSESEGKDDKLVTEVQSFMKKLFFVISEENILFVVAFVCLIFVCFICLCVCVGM